jgi:hypothetical protein
MHLVAHDIFMEQYRLVTEKYPLIKTSLDKQLEKAAADPFNAGEQLRLISDPNLKQKLLKVWVRGEHLPKKKGHRLLYLVVKEKTIVLPFFISPEPREDFDYAEYDWEASAKQIYADVMEWKREKLRIFEPWRDAG